MKFVDEFCDSEIAKKIAQQIKAEVELDRDYSIMEFCGGHTHAIFTYGIQDLMPDNVRFTHGPGCPVCVLPMGRLDMAIEMAEKYDVILCSYGDMMRVPASKKKSLIKAKAEGADVRMVYSLLNALKIAEDNPSREVVFFAIGFETTTPTTAAALQTAISKGIKNFSVFCNHILTPAAISHILQSKEVRKLGTVKIDGFLGPSHVSSIIGAKPYEFFAEEFQKPVVIAGFEPLDVMQSSLMIIRQVNEGRYEVENEYSRVVTYEGNKKAKNLISKYFELRKDFEWRGLGFVPYSALKIRDEFSLYDAEKRFELTDTKAQDVKGCECPAILRGVKKPTDCKLFGVVCTPDNPQGSCMVSSEGSCAAYWSYGRFRDINNTNKKAEKSMAKCV